MFVKRQRGGEESASGELQCLWVCVECVLVLGWCCSGTEGTCIFAIKLLPMRAHRGRNHRAGPSVVISYLKNKVHLLVGKKKKEKKFSTFATAHNKAANSNK